MRGWGVIMRKAVILGTGAMGRSIFSTLVRSPKFGLDPVAFVEAEATIAEAGDLRSVVSAQTAGNRTARTGDAQTTAQAGSERADYRGPDLSAGRSEPRLLSQAEAAGVSTYVIPEPFLEPGYAMEYVELDGVMLAHKAAQKQKADVRGC